MTVFVTIGTADEPDVAPAAAAAPATTQASVDLSRFDESLHAPLLAWRAWVDHLVEGEVDAAVAMMPVAPRASAASHRRACRNISREYRKPGGVPKAITGTVVGESAVLLLAMPQDGGKKWTHQRFYLLHREDRWQIVGFNIAVFTELYDDAQFERLQQADAWAAEREQELRPGS